MGLIYDGSHGGTTTPVAGDKFNPAGPHGQGGRSIIIPGPGKVHNLWATECGPVVHSTCGHFYVAGAAAAGRKDNCCVYGTNHGEQKLHNPLTEKTSRNSHVLTTERHHPCVGILP